MSSHHHHFASWNVFDWQMKLEITSIEASDEKVCFLSFSNKTFGVQQMICFFPSFFNVLEAPF